MWFRHLFGDNLAHPARSGPVPTALFPLPSARIRFGIPSARGAAPPAARQDEYRADPSCSVVEADFYNAATLLPLSDDALEDRVVDRMLAGRWRRTRTGRAGPGAVHDDE